MIKKAVIAILMMVPFYGFGQYLEFGPLGGVTYYIGDLNPKIHFNFSKPAFGGIIRYNFTPRWALRASIIAGKMEGDDTKTEAVKNRNLKFTSNITEISLQGELHFFKFITGSQRNCITPYVFGGVGIMLFNPQTVVNGEMVSLRDMGTEGQYSAIYPERSPYNLTQICIPFGMGVKFSFAKRFCVTFEWGMRKLFTDYLDDCSMTYYLDNEITNFNNPASVASDPTKNHKVGDKRGESQFNDWYNFTGITLTYKIIFQKSSKCIDFDEKKYYH